MQGQSTQLIFDITNITRGFRDSSQKPDKLQYCIEADSATWNVGGATSGVVHAPHIAQTTSVRVIATPKRGGSLQVPHISLVLEEGDGEGGKEKGGRVKLTGAQYYNMSRCHFVEVQEQQ